MSTVIRNAADGLVYLIDAPFTSRYQLESPLPDYFANLTDRDFSTGRPEEVNFSYRGGVVQARKRVETDIISYCQEYVAAETNNNYTLAVFDRHSGPLKGLTRTNEFYQGNNISIMNIGDSLTVMLNGVEDIVFILDHGATMIIGNADVTLSNHRYTLVSNTNNPVSVLTLISALMVQSPPTMISPATVTPVPSAPKKSSRSRQPDQGEANPGFQLPAAKEIREKKINLKLETPNEGIRCMEEDTLQPLNSHEFTRVAIQRTKDLINPKGNAVPFVDYGDLTDMIEIAFLELEMAKKHKEVADKFEYMSLSRFCNKTKKMVDVPVSDLFGH